MVFSVGMLLHLAIVHTIFRGNGTPDEYWMMLGELWTESMPILTPYGSPNRDVSAPYDNIQDPLRELSTALVLAIVGRTLA